MDFEKFWSNVVFAKWGIGVFLAIFAALWLLAEPIGATPGVQTFGFLAISASLLTSLWLVGRKFYACRSTIRVQAEEIDSLKEELEKQKGSRSYCCVRQQETSICPLGVTAIYNEAITTLQSSILEAKHTYRWLGFTAFNVAHNNREIFTQRKHVKFEFVTLSPDAELLFGQVDKDYRSTLRASEQSAKGKSILSEIAKEVPSLSVLHHHQVPSFRVILIDSSKALVSFYEWGKDALRTHQVEFSDNPNAPFSLFRWFEMFYNKVIQTEQLVRRTGTQETAE